MFDDLEKLRGSFQLVLLNGLHMCIFTMTTETRLGRYVVALKFIIGTHSFKINCSQNMYIHRSIGRHGEGCFFRLNKFIFVH